MNKLVQGKTIFVFLFHKIVILQVSGWGMGHS